MIYLDFVCSAGAHENARRFSLLGAMRVNRGYPPGRPEFIRMVTRGSHPPAANFTPGSFENPGRDGRCECGRGRPHDSRSGDRRYRAVASFMPGCERKDHG